MAASEPETHPSYDAGEVAMPMDKAEWIEQQIKEEVPDYQPGRVLKSVAFLNDAKASIVQLTFSLFG